MIKCSPFAVVLAAALAAPAAASEDKQADIPDSERVVCKTQRATGSRLAGGRICKSKAQWDAEKKDADRRMDELIEERSSTVTTAG